MTTSMVMLGMMPGMTGMNGMMQPGMMPQMMNPFGMMPGMVPPFMMPQNPGFVMQHQTTQPSQPQPATNDDSDESLSDEDEEATARGMTNARWLGGPTAARCVPKRVKIQALCQAKDELDAGQLVPMLPKELGQVFFVMTRLAPGVKLCELGATKKKAILYVYIYFSIFVYIYMYRYIYIYVYIYAL